MTISELLRALDDPTRLRMLRLLSRMELAVGELAEVLEQSQPRISRHVRILTEAGLAEKRKEGSWVFLRSLLQERGANTDLAGAAGRLLSSAERSDAEFAAVCARDRTRLAAIRDARASSAERYFARHADEWDRLRSLHISDGAVETRLSDMLSVGAGDTPLGRLLDIGTGTGRMAELFAPHATHVTAIDKSPEMLRIARARLQHLPPSRMTLLQGDFHDLPFADAAFDTVLFHQVLHYAQDPHLVLAEAARVTAPGGRIAIVDFAAHTHEDLREAHAHARLGFGDDQMAALLRDTGFVADEDAALAGSQLTIRIWTATRHPSIHQKTGQTTVTKAAVQ